MIKKFILGLFVLFFGVSFCYGNVSVGPLSFGSLGVNPNQSSSTAGIVSDIYYNFDDGIFTYTEQGERVFNLWWYSGFLKYTTAGSSFLPSGNGTIDGYFLCQVGYHVSMPDDPRQSPICVFRNGFSDMGTYTYGLDSYSVNCAYGTCLLKMYKSGYYYNSEEVSSYAVLIGQYSGYQNVLGNDFLSLSDIQYSDSPVGGSTDYFDNGGIGIGSDFSAINYYEKTYGRDESICYAGVDNLNTLYGQNGVSFQKGYGLSLFQVFSGLYNGDQDLTHMYVWLNSLLGNYELWFAIGSPTLTDVGNPPYLLNYNSGTHLVDVNYDNLTFPFAGKPVALYYIASNIEEQSPYNTMGASVVSYCNLKINGGSFDDIVSDADKNNINGYTEQYNTNQGLNEDGSDIEHDGYFGSGVSIAFSGDTSIKNTLKNFFDAFDNGLSIIDVNTNNRILPTWLVSAFIFVVLFKFLRKR